MIILATSLDILFQRNLLTGHFKQFSELSGRVAGEDIAKASKGFPS